MKVTWDSRLYRQVLVEKLCICVYWIQQLIIVLFLFFIVARKFPDLFQLWVFHQLCSLYQRRGSLFNFVTFNSNKINFTSFFQKVENDWTSLLYRTLNLWEIKCWLEVLWANFLHKRIMARNLNQWLWISKRVS